MKASWRPQEIVALLKRRGGAAATHGDVREPMRRRHPRATLRQDRGNFPRRRLPASAYQAAGSLGIPASKSGLAPVVYGQFRIHVLRHTFISRRVPPGGR